VKHTYLITVILCLLNGCNRDFSVNEPPLQSKVATTWSSPERSAIQTGNSFGQNLFTSVLKTEKNKNVVLSPLSATLALAMTCNGAAGETEKAIQNVLGFADTPATTINATLQHLCNYLVKADSKVGVDIANAIWYRKDKVIETDFINISKNYFSAVVAPLDFADPKALLTVNGWVNENTHNRIPTILDGFPANTIMVLLNALCFKGTWTYQFDPNLTTAYPFYPTATTQISCPMMTQSNTFSYYSDEQMQAVDLPYASGAFSMTLILPQSGSSEAAMIERLQTMSLSSWLARFNQQEGTIRLPRFKTEYDIVLNDILKKLGMAIAFEGGRADFSRLCKGDLYIDLVKQKTFIQVDEEGTEAAAATVVVIVERGGGPTGFSMTLNRPFYFLLRETSSNALLFVGYIAQPAWS
jgi:serine protease inhibitor